MALSKALTVKFHEVPQGGLEFEFTQTSGELNASLFDILGDFPVYKAELQVRPAESMVHLKGHISGELNHICSRCAEEFRQHYDKAFMTAYYKSDDSMKSSAMEDLEGSFDLEFLEGNDIELGEVIHEQIALEIPFKPLCTEECKGLCSQCGANLNNSNCTCSEKGDVLKPNSPFAKLKSLRGE